MEQASSSVYAQGGRGNARLIAWQGDKTLTFTVTDALISPVSLSMLSGAGLVKESGQRVHVNATTAATMTVSGGAGTIDLTEALVDFGSLTGNDAISIVAGVGASIFIIRTEDYGSITGDIVVSGSTSPGISYKYDAETSRATLNVPAPKWNSAEGNQITDSINVLVDYYVIKKSDNVSEIQLTAQDFAGYYYVEADTLFRSQATGIDMPANLTFPNVKVQSGFTISMAGTGDPSTFNFTMDAFPGYTYFDKSKQVLCVIQVVEDSLAATTKGKSVMLSNDTVEHRDPLTGDSDLYDPAG